MNIEAIHSDLERPMIIKTTVNIIKKAANAMKAITTMFLPILQSCNNSNVLHTSSFMLVHF